MKYKALILDLDGTTVPSARDGMPSEKVRHAVLKANSAVNVCIATGRPFDLSSKILEVLDIKQPCVVDGGAEIIDMKDNAVLLKQYISPTKQMEVLEVTSRFGLQLYGSENQYGADPLSLDRKILSDTPKLFIDGISASLAVKLFEELELVDGIAPHLASSWSSGDVVDVHITHAGATKKHGVEKLIGILGVAKQEVIGIGDNHNDLPMLEAVGFKVVMGNAPDEVKQAADFVAPSLEEDGVAAVIEKFILAR